MNIWSVGHRRVVLFSTTPEKLVSGRHNHNEIMRTRTFVCRLLLVRVSVCVDYFHDGEPNPPDPSSWIDNVIGYGSVWYSFFLFLLCARPLFSWNSRSSEGTCGHNDRINLNFRINAPLPPRTPRLWKLPSNPPLGGARAVLWIHFCFRHHPVRTWLCCLLLSNT